KTHFKSIDYNVFEGIEVEGVVDVTICRGKVVWENGIDEINGATAQGKSDCTAATSGFTGCCTGNAVDGKNNVWVNAYAGNNTYILKGGA
ncbi:MAG: hypothetical protein KKF42_08975, partial [Actinobacteria bacterium]|nr:hypothetical protein [Actinomycetota bacterium]